MAGVGELELCFGESAANGVAAIVYTDIARDGVLKGLRFAST